MFSSYITVPVYADFYRWLGYGEQIEPMVQAWEAGDRQAAAAAAPWELIEDMFIFGTPEQMKERLAAFVAGGITLPILTPIVTPDKLAETIDALAPLRTLVEGTRSGRRAGASPSESDSRERSLKPLESSRYVSGVRIPSSGSTRTCSRSVTSPRWSTAPSRCV